MQGIFGPSIDTGQSSPDVDEIFGLNSGAPNDGKVIDPAEGQGDPDNVDDTPSPPDDEAGGQLGDEPSDDTQQPTDQNKHERRPWYVGKNGQLLSKFKSEDALEQAYIELMENKLGRSVDGIEFSSVEQLADAYTKAEKEFYSKASKQKKTDDNAADKQSRQPAENDELTKLQQTVQQQQAQLQQAALAIQRLLWQAEQQQQLQQQPNPQLQLQQAVTQQQIQQQIQQQYKPEELLDELYNDPASVIQKVVDPIIEQKAQELQRLYQQQYQWMTQQLTPVQALMTQMQRASIVQQQLANIQNKYPDFNDLEHEIQAELKNNPQALRTIQVNPGTAEIFIEAAYNKVKANKLLQQSLQAQQQNVQAQQEQQKRVLKAQKEASRIQTGESKRVLRRPSPEEQEIADIFGLGTKKKGIFG